MLFLLNLIPLLLLTESNAKPVTLSKRLTNVRLQSGRDNKCLSVPDGNVDRGTAIITVNCNVARTWDINPGSGSVFLSGTGLALDAGSTPGNNGNVKLWTSYPGLYQQTWYFTGDNRIAITGGDQCLDSGPNGPQTYRCTPGNVNQIWFANPPNNPPPTTNPPPASGILPNFPRGPVYDQAGENGRRIHPYGRDDLCFNVKGTPGVGSIIEINYCLPPNDGRVKNQLFTTVGARFSTPIQLTSQPDLCIDLGSNPSNGGVVKLWSCIYALPQQQIYFPRGGEDGKIGAVGQCIDVAEGGNGRLQTWQCFPNNFNQNLHVGIF